MPIVNKVDKRVRMGWVEIIRYQLFTHCYLEKLQVSDADIDTLTLLACDGETELTSFCDKVFALQIFKSTQTVRNAITKAEKKGLILKEGKSKKRIFINPDVKIQCEGNIMLDYKFLFQVPIDAKQKV
jgi:hypothetical protein